MARRRTFALVFTALFLAPVLLLGNGSPVLQPAARIVAIGDIHGAGAAFREILQAAGLTGADGRWSGGNTTFVQTGDYTDRGDEVRPVLDLLMALEDQAKAAGGRAEILMGNHEVMTILRDSSYVSEGALAAFADGKSEDRRRKAFESHADLVRRTGARGDAPFSEAEWMKTHPRGYVEYVDAFLPRGKYGRWLRSRKAITRVERTAFMHAGLAPDFTGTLDDVNRTVSQALRDWDAASDLMVREKLITPYFTLKETVAAAGAELLRIGSALEANQPVGEHVTREWVQTLKTVVQIGDSPLLAGSGPMWFRGLSASPTEETGEQVTALLKLLDVSRIVVGHTPALPGKITPRFDGRVFPIDTGMLGTYFKGGRASALELKGDEATAIYTTGREPLPRQ